MQKRPYLILIFITLMLLTIAVPAIAQEDFDIRHSIRMFADGQITIDRELGHACTTGAVKTQTVRGFGQMTRIEEVRIAPHIITVDEQTDWTTAVDAIINLSVTTTIDLCARPKSVAAHTYEDPEGNFVINEGDVISPYHPLVVSGDVAVIGMTSQTWGAFVSANPGEQGSYHSDFIAAYGPGPIEERFGQIDELGEVTFFDEEFRWWFDDSKRGGIDRGDRYVGNYFEIDQYAFTSGGEMRRFIDISSPFSHGILVDIMEVTGRAEVRESFELDNLEPGPRARRLTWYELY